MAKKQKHRGRIQAQGEGLEASETWHQEEPLTRDQGLFLLQKLQNKIPPDEQKKRERPFKDAERFIKQSEGGVDAPVRKTFRNRKTKDVRVDIEVWSGTAFVTIVLLMLLLWRIL